MKNLNDIVDSGLCLGCGLCTLNQNFKDVPVTLKYSNLKGIAQPVKSKSNSQNFIHGFNSCPAKGYNINSMAQELGFGNNFKLELGYYNTLKTVTSKNSEVLEQASSSGIMTLLPQYLMSEKLVDAAIVTKFEYTETGPVAKPFIAHNYTDLVSAQGSKYCPVNFSEILNKLINNQQSLRYVFVGTPCQIASLRTIQRTQIDLGIKYFVGNFCGGYKSYNNLKQLIKLNKINPEDVSTFRFRGGGQPGSLLIQTPKNEITIPYPEYVKTTGYLKLKRCHLCVDATAELADFACGDAWLPEFESKTIPTSIVIARNKNANEILLNMEEAGIIQCNNISGKDVIKSQFGNIQSKKYRQQSRLKLYTLIRKKVPHISEGFKTEEKVNLMLELNILVRHNIKLFFEKLGLYYLLYYKKTAFQRVILKYIFKR